MFPPIPSLINVDMIYQLQANPFCFVPGFNPNPIIQQMPQQNPYLSQLIQQQLINNQIQFQNSISASIFATSIQQQQQHSNVMQMSSLPTSSNDTEINDQIEFQQDASFPSTIKFATWNVRGALELEKRIAIDKCLNDKQIDIACIQETKLQMSSLDTTNYKWHLITKKNDHNYHCGTAILVKHNFQAAVSNFEAITGNILSCFVRTKELTILVISAHFIEDLVNEIEFERLKNFLKLYESLPTIILGDFNAQLGKSDIADEDCVFMGRYLYHDKCNNNGRLLKDLASEAKLFIKNTFHSHKVYKWKYILTTCKLKDKTSTNKAEESQIDHILTSREGIVFVKMLRGYYKNHIHTDHKMIVADVEIRNFESGTTDKAPDVIDLSQEDDVPMESSHKNENRINGDGATNLLNTDPTVQTSINRKRNRRKLRKRRDKSAGNNTVLRLPSTQTQELSVNHHQVDVEQDDLEVLSNNPPIEEIEMQISPGEPVPPGFEDMVKPVAELQVILSKYRNAPLIGLEYIIELIMGDRRPRTYHCALCDRICDTKDIIDHIISYDHRCRYLEKHFSTAMSLLSQYRNRPNAKDVLASVIEELCDSIEVAYGRMVPSVFENNDYTANRAIYMRKLARERHFDEKSGSTFVSVIHQTAIESAFETLAETFNTNKSIVKNARTETVVSRSKSHSFESISSDCSDRILKTESKTKKRTLGSVEPVVIDQINLDLISSDEEDAYRKKRKKSSSPPASRPTPTLRYSNHDETDEFKYERYRNIAKQAVDDLMILLKEYEKYPEKHPLYPSEWNRYWLRRSDELKSMGVDPRTYDFSSEWSKYWLRRMRELFDEDVALKKVEIRKKLNLSPNFYPKSSSSNYSKISSSSSYSKISPSSSYSVDESRGDESRTMLRHNPDKSEEDVENGQVTIISVLRLLTAFEDLLGASLGPKVVDLLSKAVALEKVKANLADDLLMTEENSVLLDTIKEKLKGLIIADVLKSQQINAVRKAIRNVTSIVTVIDNKLSAKKVQTESHERGKPDAVNMSEKTKPQSAEIKKNIQTQNNSRSEVIKQIATAFLIQKINISNDRLEKLADIYISKSNQTNETPYLFGVHVSQKFVDNNGANDFSSSRSRGSSSSKLQFQQENSVDSGSSFPYNSFQNNKRNLGNATNVESAVFSSANSGNFSCRPNTADNRVDSYSQQKSYQSNSNFNQSNQNYRSQDNLCNSLSQQSSTCSNPSFSKNFDIQMNNQHTQQRNNFNQQHANNDRNTQQQQLNNMKNHYNQSNQRNQLQIWDSQPVMLNNSNSNNKFDHSTNFNSIWETNPMQNQQQFKQAQIQQQYNRSQNQQQFNQTFFQRQNDQSQSSNYSQYRQQNSRR